MNELNIAYLSGLVLRAKGNDSNAFAELYAMTYKKVYNYTRHYLRDDFLAQDALQEIYILALKNLSKLNDPTVFIAWLDRISFHVCFDMTKKLQKGNTQFSDPEILEVIEDEYPGSDPEASYQRKDETSRLNEALEQLPFHERQVLIMRFYNDMKLEDIAAAMDISRSSVKRYIASGEEKLKKIMKG